MEPPSTGLLISLILSALFFLLELAISIALTAAAALSPVALRRLAGECDPRYEFLERLDDPSSGHRLAAAVSRGLAMAAAILSLVVAAVSASDRDPQLVWPVAVVLAGILAGGPVVAGALAAWNARVTLRRTAFLLFVAFGALRPVARLLRPFLERLQSSNSEAEEGNEEVEAYIEVGEREGILDGTESEMMRSIVDLDETYVREIMTPRTRIVALPEETTVAGARQTFVGEGHSRVPVFRGSIENVIGVLHIRDVLRLSEEGRDAETVGIHVREAMVVPETLTVSALLGRMRQSTHLALVVDEYGGLAGLITLEDLLEEIVGDIRDEHDLEERRMRREADGSWLVDAELHVGELESLFGVDFGERDYDTVGGLVVAGLGHLPDVGERVAVEGLEIEVVKADRRRIHVVRVRGSQHRAAGTRVEA